MQVVSHWKWGLLAAWDSIAKQKKVTFKNQIGKMSGWKFDEGQAEAA